MRRILAFLSLSLLPAQTVPAQTVPAQTVDDAMRMAAAGRVAQAIAALESTAAAEPSDADVRYRLGLLLLKAGRERDGAARLEESAVLAPEWPFGWLALADARARLGNREGAQQAATRAAGAAASNATAWRGVAVVARRLGAAQLETQALAIVAQLAPGDPKPRARLIQLLLEHRTAAPALREADAALAAFPEAPEFQRLRGLALLGLGRTEDALAALLAAIDAAPADEASYASLETLLPDAGAQLPAIVERLERASMLLPASPLPPFLLAAAQAGRAEADGFLLEALKRDAEFWPARYLRATRLLSEGKRDLARAEFEQTLQSNPDHAGAHFSLAAIFLAQGDREQARRHREEHHRLREREAEAERQRRAAAPRLDYRAEEPSRSDKR